jgi:hypothetical protein
MGSQGSKTNAAVADVNSSNNDDGSNKHACVRWCCYRSGKTGRKSMICCEWTYVMLSLSSPDYMYLIITLFAIHLHIVHVCGMCYQRHL